MGIYSVNSASIDNLTISSSLTVYGSTQGILLSGSNIISPVSNSISSSFAATSSYTIGTATTASYVEVAQSASYIIGQTYTEESTGVLTGGVLSVGTGGPGVATTFNISDGTGQVVDYTGSKVDVSWSGLTDVSLTYLATNLISFIAINSAGAVVQSATKFTPQQARQYIVLGVVVHVNFTNVDTVNNEQKISYNAMSSAYDGFESLGFFNVSGNVFSANGANMNINKSAGVLFKMGSNYDTDVNNPHRRSLVALTPAQFQYRFSNGSSGILTETNIDPNNLDNGTGGLTAVGVNKWSVQRIYSFTSNNVKIQRGVEEFATQADAIAGITTEAYVTEPSIAANGLFRGWLIVKQGATALNGADALFLAAGKLGEQNTGGGGAGGGGAAFPFTGNAEITGSLLVSGSNVDFTNATGVSGSFSGSFVGNGSGLTGVTAEWDGTHTGNAEITGSLTISGSGAVLNTQEAQFDINHIAAGHSTGRVYWDATNATLAADMVGSNVTLQLGQEQHVYARNTSGNVINNGDVVRIAGVQGDQITIEKALAVTQSLTDPDRNEVIGVATEQILNNNFGYVTTFGTVRDIDTSAFQTGSIVYLSHIDSGSFTDIRPPAPHAIVRIGVVERSHPTAGTLFTRPESPQHINDITGITSSNIPIGVSYWEYDSATKVTSLSNQLNVAGITGSLFGTASYALLAETASYTITTFVTQSQIADTASFVTASNVFGPYGSNSIISSSYAVNALSSSYAVTASHALNAGATATKYFRNMYMYNVIAAAGTGYNWNGVNNVAAPTAAVVSSAHPHRLYNFSGTNNQHQGIYFEQQLPSYYTAGANIRVTINVVGNTLTGGAVYYCGLTQPTAANVLGGTTDTEWIAQTATFTGVTGYHVISLTYTFTGTNITPGDSLLFRVYRDPNDAADNLGVTGIVTIGIEEL